MISLATFQRLTRLEQGFFGLPFVLAGALLPFSHTAFIWENRWLYVLPAFFLARISGMAFNQLIDRKIDALNPRTKNRVLSTGEASPKQVGLLAALSLIGFVSVCWKINTLCFALSFVAAPLLFFYSYLKRYNSLCHFVLGAIHLLGPVMAYAAVTGTLSFAPLFLGMSSLLLIAGSDIIYALQDVAFDREYKLYSIPAKLGVEKALGIAKLSHLIAGIALFLVGYAGHLAWIYYIAPIGAFVVFHFLHRALDGALRQKKNIMPFFLTTNIIIAALALVGTLFSGLWNALL